MNFWRTFWGMAIRPRSTLTHIEQDDKAILQGFWALLFVSAVYTLILIIFIWRGYPAAVPSILPIATQDLYKYQVWYQGPVFLAATGLTAWVLTLFARFKGGVGQFGVAFARISLATCVPFAFTTMLVELSLALLLWAGILESAAVFNWFTGDGNWFANMYQLVALGWMCGLLAITVRLTVGIRWWLSVVLGVVLLVIYGLPIAFIIR